MSKWLAFDIETAQAPPSAHEGNYALGITCTVFQAEGNDPRHYCGSVQPNGSYALRMEGSDVRALAIDLMSYACAGFKVVGINSAGFDLRVMAEECRDTDIYRNLRGLALDHYDPCFQMFCQRGFPVGLNALAKGFGLGSKTEGMDGSKAASDWLGTREDQERVLAYCEQDARLTLDVALNIESASQIRWISKKGKDNWEPVERLLTVRECLQLPLPDTSWMDNPWSREKFAGWLDE